MGVAEGGLGGETVGSGAAGAENFFDGAAESETDAIEIARDAGFVLGELTADFGKGFLFGVIKAEALFVARIEGGESGLQGAYEKSDVAFSIGIRRLYRNGLRCFLDGLHARGFAVIVVEGFEAAIGADEVDVTLCENGAKPGFERTAAVKITEEGAFAASAIGEAVELGEERVGEFASFGGSRAAAEDGGCGGAKVWAIGGDEMLPGRFAIFHASGGERQILEMEGGEIFVKFLSREASTSQALLGASLQRRREMVRRKTPIGTIRLRIKGLEPGWAGHNSLRSASAAGGLPGLSAVCGVFLHLFR